MCLLWSTNWGFIFQKTAFFRKEANRNVLFWHLLIDWAEHFLDRTSPLATTIDYVEVNWNETSWKAATGTRCIKAAGGRGEAPHAELSLSVVVFVNRAAGCESYNSNFFLFESPADTPLPPTPLLPPSFQRLLSVVLPFLRITSALGMCVYLCSQIWKRYKNVCNRISLADPWLQSLNLPWLDNPI
jgi:hypothetical protein